MMKWEIALLLTWLVPSLATCPAIHVKKHEQTCDSSTWVCRIMCSQDMLPGARNANWCVKKHCASPTRRHRRIVEGMMAAGRDYCSKDLCFIQESEATGLLQKPSRGSNLVTTQVNATGHCLTESDWVLEYYTFILLLVLGSYYSYLYLKSIYFFFQGLLQS